MMTGVPTAEAPSVVRVLVVDDSPVIRHLMTELLSGDPGIRVVGTAADAYIARDKIKRLHPDVLTLDIEMPRMDGLTFLRNLMRLRPMPVVMVSSLTARGASLTLDALACGAVDVIGKPLVDTDAGLAEYAAELRRKVRDAARAHVAPRNATAPPAGMPDYRSADRLFAIGASTGGTEALREVIAAMPEDAPPIVIAQHIPAPFSAPFAERLDRCSRMRVVEAEHGQPLLQGHAYIAPGGRHLRIHRSGARWLCRLDETELVNGHRPSVDVLFASVATQAGSSASAALLTGMGSDGARGMRALRDAGAATIAQDQPSSVVWGMPGAAVALDAAQQVLPLYAIAPALLASTLRAAS